MSKKLLSIFIILSMFSFMGCVVCSANHYDYCYGEKTINPGETVEIPPCSVANWRSDCCTFNNNFKNLESFKVRSDNPLTNFTLYVKKYHQNENINAIGFAQANLTSSILPTFKILNNANYSDTFRGNLTINQNDAPSTQCTCKCIDPGPTPSSSTSSTVSFGAILGTILGLLAL